MTTALGVHPTLAAASRCRYTRALQSLIDVVRRSPIYTNQYTNLPETTVNDEQPNM